MRYFVTGATGFIGSALVRQLLAGGDEVVALVRDPSRAPAGVDPRRGDIGDRESIRNAMRGTDGVFHLAGWYRVGDRDQRAAWEINVQGTGNVLEAMRELEIPRGVYTSTLAVFSDTHGQVVDESYKYTGKHLSVYDQTKWVAHYEVAEPAIAAGLPLIVVQPGAVYGVGDTSPLGRALDSYLQGKLAAVPSGTAYCWGHVEDTAAGHVLAMRKGRVGESYIIAGPPHSLVEALATAERVTGIRSPRTKLPAAFLRAVARVLKTFEAMPGWPRLEAEQTAEYLRVSAGVTYLGSNARAREQLGFSPRSLETGFREVLTEQSRRLGVRLGLAATP